MPAKVNSSISKFAGGSKEDATAYYDLSTLYSMPSLVPASRDAVPVSVYRVMDVSLYRKPYGSRPNEVVINAIDVLRNESACFRITRPVRCIYIVVRKPEKDEEEERRSLFEIIRQELDIPSTDLLFERKTEMINAFYRDLDQGRVSVHKVVFLARSRCSATIKLATPGAITRVMGADECPAELVRSWLGKNQITHFTIKLIPRAGVGSESYAGIASHPVDMSVLTRRHNRISACRDEWLIGTHHQLHGVNRENTVGCGTLRVWTAILRTTVGMGFTGIELATCHCTHTNIRFDATTNSYRMVTAERKPDTHFERDICGSIQSDLRSYDPDIILLFDTNGGSGYQTLCLLADAIHRSGGLSLETRGSGRLNAFSRTNFGGVHGTGVTEFKRGCIAEHAIRDLGLFAGRIFIDMDDTLTGGDGFSFPKFHSDKELNNERISRLAFDSLCANGYMAFLSILSELTFTPIATLAITGRMKRIESMLTVICKLGDYIPPHSKQKCDIQFTGGDTCTLDLNQSESISRLRGGTVLEPETGFYPSSDSNVIVCDYRSMYPSIIADDMICFIQYEKAKEQKFDTILPKMMRGLTTTRYMLQTQAGGDAQCANAIKVITNAIYGCISSPHCRFYALGVAQRITEKGRRMLRHAKEIANSMGYKAIYGDTDSLFIQQDGAFQGERSSPHEVCDAINSSEIVGQDLPPETDRISQIRIQESFASFMIFKKKRYIGVTTLGTVSFKGVISGKKLTCAAACRIYTDMAMHVLSIAKRADAAGVEEGEQSVGTIRMDYLTRFSKVFQEEIRSPMRWAIIHRLDRPLMEYRQRYTGAKQPDFYAAGVSDVSMCDALRCVSYVRTETSGPTLVHYYVASRHSIDFKWYIRHHFGQALIELFSPFGSLSIEQLIDACLIKEWDADTQSTSLNSFVRLFY